MVGVTKKGSSGGGGVAEGNKADSTAKRWPENQ